MTRRDENYSATVAAALDTTEGGGGDILRTLRVFPSKCLHNIFQRIYFGPGPENSLETCRKTTFAVSRVFSFFRFFLFFFLQPHIKT